MFPAGKFFGISYGREADPVTIDYRHQHHPLLCCEYKFRRPDSRPQLKLNEQTILFERLGISDTKSRIIAACNGTEYFLASFIAVALIERVGRRKLMFFGSIGQTLTMVLLAILGSINKPAAQIISAVLLFVFNSFFAVGWLGMTWLYVGYRI